MVVAFHGVTKHAAVGVEASDLASRQLDPGVFNQLERNQIAIVIGSTHILKTSVNRVISVAKWRVNV